MYITNILGIETLVNHGAYDAAFPLNDVNFDILI